MVRCAALSGCFFLTLESKKKKVVVIFQVPQFPNKSMQTIFYPNDICPEVAALRGCFPETTLSGHHKCQLVGRR